MVEPIPCIFVRLFVAPIKGAFKALESRATEGHRISVQLIIAVKTPQDNRKYKNARFKIKALC